MSPGNSWKSTGNHICWSVRHPVYNMYPSLIEIGSKTAEKNCKNKQTDRHYENNGHLAVNQNSPLFPEWCTTKEIVLIKYGDCTDNRCILALQWSSLCDDEADAGYLRPFLACIDDITAVTL